MIKHESQNVFTECVVVSDVYINALISGVAVAQTKINRAGGGRRQRETERQREREGERERERERE